MSCFPVFQSFPPPASAVNVNVFLIQHWKPATWAPRRAPDPESYGLKLA